MCLLTDHERQAGTSPHQAAEAARGNGVVSVTDKDVSVTLYVQLNQPINNERLVDTKTIEHPTRTTTSSPCSSCRTRRTSLPALLLGPRHV